MLRRLFIRDFIIVEQLELEFETGFTALTGETGAGKSILIDALSLALGERAEASCVRAGGSRAEIAASFVLAGGPDHPLRRWLQDNAFDQMADHADSSQDECTCLLRRIIDSSGRSRAYINGATATLGQLRAAAEMLCDIHGQHAHHGLLRTETQRELLDAHAGILSLAGEVAQSYRQWQQLLTARLNAERDASSLERERETLLWQVEELHALAFNAEEWQEINQEHHRASHAATLIQGVDTAMDQLETGENTLIHQLEQMHGQLTSLSHHDAGLQETLVLLNDALIPLQEAAHALRHYQRHLELDPARLEMLEERIAAIHACARKYRLAVDELPDFIQQQETRLQELETAVDLTELAARAAQAEAGYRQLATRLTQARLATARQLSAAVSTSMQQLAMAGGRFEVQLTPLDQPTAHGLEAVEFMVSANAGQALRPLARTASGGELSRIGLAIQVIASQAAQAPTLIFDEVDVGIGGGVAEIVGRLLQDLGRIRQVLCVTHLPQVAACANQQWNVSKQEENGYTLSHITPLNEAGRIDELARMLGGLKITATTRRHAAEMLAAAHQPAR